MTSRSGTPSAPRVALESTLLLHGVPSDSALDLDRVLRDIVRDAGAEPALVGVVDGVARVDLEPEDLTRLLQLEHVEKLNSSNLGIAIHRGMCGATTVSATMELAASQGITFFATGGLGGVHDGYGIHFDISADLGACARFPVGVVTSGTKSILDVASTREALETLGVPVVGFQTDAYPAFYLRQTDPPIAIDARFDDVTDLAAFVLHETQRTGRGVVICNPIPNEHEIDRRRWDDLLASACRVVGDDVSGRDVTPRLLAALHAESGGETLRANIELVKSNALLAARLACSASTS